MRVKKERRADRGASGHADAQCMQDVKREAEQNERAGLMRRRQRDRRDGHQRGGAERELHPGTPARITCHQKSGITRQSRYASRRWLNCTVAIFSNRLIQNGCMAYMPSGKKRPFIHGKVLKANPALVPATNPPERIMRKTRPVTACAKRRNPGGVLTGARSEMRFSAIHRI